MSDRQEQWAVFWCSLLSPLLYGEVSPQEAGRFLNELASREHVFPDGRRRRPSRATLWRKWKKYRDGGFEALFRKRRKDRGQPRKATPAMIAKAVELKKEQPRRSDVPINQFLEAEFKATIPKSTLYQHLRRAGATRLKLGISQRKVRCRWTRDYSNALWLGDFEDGPCVLVDGQAVTTHLSAFIDCHSRYSPTFRPRARMLLLLGDQLIRDAGLAVFELVKNAYDADATSCTVTMRNITDPARASVTIEDDGLGMDRATITGVWLEPGTDYRAKQRIEKKRTSKFRRVPLGEKGVGRFAVHKLGQLIELVTRQGNKEEVVVRINWADFARDKYLSEVPVSVETRSPQVFTGKRTGTRIQVTQLHDKNWTRGKVRELQRAITSICSPFGEPDDFRASLILEPDFDWLEGLLDMKTVLQQSLFRASGYIRGSELIYDYEFRPLKAMRQRLEGRKVKGQRCTLGRLQGRGNEGQSLDLSLWDIGEVRFDLHIFDREPAVLELSTTDRAGLKKFLDQNGGIRVYRDGMRVFDFGEPGNDWLDLGGRRVNIPTVRVSNNQVIGAVSLHADESQDLIEKTNREGFIENDACEAFTDAVLFAITQVEADRKIDKKRLREQYSRTTYKEPVLDDLTELREEIDKRNLTKELGKYINRIETQFTEVRNTLITAAGAGLTLTTVIHEVEKIIRELVTALKHGAPRERVVDLVQHLDQMVEGLGFLVRKSGNATEKASVLISQALFNTEYRLKAHRIRATNGIEQKGDPEFSVKCVRRLIVSLLTNLMDNSIYWLENRGASDKQIYLGTTFEFSGKPALVVADNGPGFTDSPEYLVEPFFTRRPDGMGLGLHLANEVAKVHGGRLIFPDRNELTLPEQFTGAIVALEFPDQK